MYCTKCYQNEVVQAKDASVTFAELLKSTAAVRPERRAISIVTDCKKFVDNFIHQCKMTRTIDQYYAWEKENKLRYNKSQKRKSQMEWGVFFGEKTQYLAEKKAYDTVIDLAIKEYAISTDGVVKALRYNAREDKFMAKVSYIDTLDQVQENVMHVTNEWCWTLMGKHL